MDRIESSHQAIVAGPVTYFRYVRVLRSILQASDVVRDLGVLFDSKVAVTESAERRCSARV